MDSSSTSSTSSHSSSSSSDDDILYDMDEEATMFFQWGLVPWSAQDFFSSHEMEGGSGQSMDPTIGVQNVLATMHATPTLFKNLTNFIAIEFEELASFVVPNTINSYARSTCEDYLVTRRP